MERQPSKVTAKKPRAKKKAAPKIDPNAEEIGMVEDLPIEGPVPWGAAPEGQPFPVAYAVVDEFGKMHGLKAHASAPNFSVSLIASLEDLATSTGISRPMFITGTILPRIG